MLHLSHKYYVFVQLIFFHLNMVTKDMKRRNVTNSAKYFWIMLIHVQIMLIFFEDCLFDLI